MKNRNTTAHIKVIWSVIVVSIVAFSFLGCQQPEEDDSVSIPERISFLISAGNNGSFDTLYTHVHPDAAQYNQLKDGDSWQPTPFKSGTTVELGTLTTSGTTVTTTITRSDDQYTGQTTTFTMKELDSDVWYILEWDINGTKIVE